MTVVKHAADALPDSPEKLVCADCQADTRDVALTARGIGLVSLCWSCARPSDEEVDAERRVWLPKLAAAWVAGDCQDHTAHEVVTRLRPDLSPMLRLALLDALGWAVRTGGDMAAAYEALVGPQNTPHTEKEAA